MSKRKLSTVKFFFICFLILLIGYLILNKNKTEIINTVSSSLPTVSSTPLHISTSAKVSRVIDGDTIEIVEEGQNASGSDGPMARRVRYIGIDTTEIYPEIECYSEEGKSENEKLVLGKTIRMEKDVSETDKYGRLLRYVYVGDVFVNEKLVRSGYARVSTYPPDVKYQMNFSESEKLARENKLGLWTSCNSI